MKQVQFAGEWTFSVEKSFILNPAISIEAKAIYLALKSFCAPGQATAFPSSSTLCQGLKISRERLYKYLRELLGLGLLVREQSSGAVGQFSYIIYTLTVDGKPVDGKPVYGKSNTNIIPEEEDIPKSNKETIQRKSAEEIYETYPRHVGRPAAIRAIMAAMKRIGPEGANYLFKMTAQFAGARKGQDPKFTPYPATWFNQERYNDDSETWGNGKVEPHKEGDAAGEINGSPAVWRKIGAQWARGTEVAP